MKLLFLQLLKGCIQISRCKNTKNFLSILCSCKTMLMSVKIAICSLSKHQKWQGIIYTGIDQPKKISKELDSKNQKTQDTDKMKQWKK